MITTITKLSIAVTTLLIPLLSGPNRLIFVQPMSWYHTCVSQSVTQSQKNCEAKLQIYNTVSLACYSDHNYAGGLCTLPVRYRERRVEISSYDEAQIL
jgi:hypothetical protein